MKLLIAQSAGVEEYTDCNSTKGVRLPHECSGYDTTESDGEAPALEIW